MRFSLRIFLGYFLLMGLLGAFLLKLVGDEIKPTVRQSAEDILAETANLLAETVRDDFVAGTLDQGTFSAAIQRFRARQPQATIWGINKRSVDLRVYVTDAAGIVRLDSAGEALGKDYSQWRDVYLTLRGRYGARSSTISIDGAPTTVMHVAAPIVVNGRIIGVLTVAKPNFSMQPYIEQAYRKLAGLTVLVVGLGLGLGALFSYWLSRGITRLTTFARHVTGGGRGPVPRLTGNRELAVLADAIGEMREKLQGKAYVEQYVHSLTHELRSPLAGIQASAELLSSDLSPTELQRFVGHISREAGRMQALIDRLLELARLEQRNELHNPETIAIPALVTSVLTSMGPQITRRHLEVRVEVPASAAVRGEVFLLEQALRNIVQNAVDNCPEAGTISIGAHRDGSSWTLSVHNTGPPIPDFALPHLFERFYSLPRAEGSNRGFGLGLPLVRSIAALHGGIVDVSNDAAGGVRAHLVLPAAS